MSSLSMASESVRFSCLGDRLQSRHEETIFWPGFERAVSDPNPSNLMLVARMNRGPHASSVHLGAIFHLCAQFESVKAPRRDVFESSPSWSLLLLKLAFTAS